jgi:tetratricopeptide (TPR) repeat protein
MNECLDTKISDEKVEERIFKFVYSEMNNVAEEDFQIHLSQCKFCYEKVMEEQERFNDIKEKLAFDEFNRSYERDDYLKTLEMERVLEKLKYSETAYPIRDKLNEIYKHIFDETKPPNNFLELMIQAEKYKQNGQYEDALKVYKKLHNLDPFDKHITYLIAVIYFEQNKLDHAKQWFENGLLINPDSIDDLIGLGSIYLFQYKLLEAEEILSRALKIEPSPETSFLLSKAYLGQDKIDEALILLENAIKVLPEQRIIEPIILAVLGETYVEKHEFNKGEVFIERARKLDPNNIYVESSMAFLKIGKTEFDEAISLLIEIKKFKPNDESIINNLAVCYYKTGILDKAIKYIKIAKSLAPNSQKIIRNFEIILGLSEDETLPMVMLH